MISRIKVENSKGCGSSLSLALFMVWPRGAGASRIKEPHSCLAVVFPLLVAQFSMRAAQFVSSIEMPSFPARVLNSIRVGTRLTSGQYFFSHRTIAESYPQKPTAACPPLNMRGALTMWAMPFGYNGRDGSADHSGSPRGPAAERMSSGGLRCCHPVGMGDLGTSTRGVSLVTSLYARLKAIMPAA